MNDDLFQIASPCHENWLDMESVPGGRFCESGTCKVHDLQQLTREEATAILHVNGRACFRVGRDRRGRILFREAGRTKPAILGITLGLGVLAGLISKFIQTPSYTTGDVMANPKEQFERMREEVTRLQESIKGERDPSASEELKKSYAIKQKELKLVAEEYRRYLEQQRCNSEVHESPTHE